MKIKELRDFKKLPLVVQKEKLQEMKKELIFIKLMRAIFGIGTAYSGILLINNNDIHLDSGVKLPLCFLVGTILMSRYVKSEFRDIVEAETIVKLEEDELTRERTL